MSLSQQDDTTVARVIHSFSVEKAVVFWLYSPQIPSFACVLFTFWVKMPWPFSESIKKRACRYLLHRYLGNFLQEKLSLDQLSLDLYQGTGSLAQVPLDKWVCGCPLVRDWCRWTYLIWTESAWTMRIYHIIFSFLSHSMNSLRRLMPLLRWLQGSSRLFL